MKPHRNLVFISSLLKLSVNLETFAFSLSPGHRVSQWAKSTPSIHNSDTSVSYIESITTVPELLASYHSSISSPAVASNLLVAPNLDVVDVDVSTYISDLLSVNSRFQGLYSPNLNAMWGPHVCLHHGPFAHRLPRVQSSEALSDAAVMDKVFVWLQRTLFGYNDDTEDDFLSLGRKLLTIDRHVVTSAASEDELSAVFWEQACLMQKQAKLIQPDDEFVEENKKNLQEDNVLKSVMVAAPQMSYHPDFKGFFGSQLEEPLKKITVLKSGGEYPLLAEAWVGKGLDFPVMLISPPLPKIIPPEGGYKVYTTKDGEVSADEYISKIEKENDIM